MKLYSSRKLYIHSDKCWPGSTKVYRADETDDYLTAIKIEVDHLVEACAEACKKRDAEIAELKADVTELVVLLDSVPGYISAFYEDESELINRVEKLIEKHRSK